MCREKYCLDPQRHPLQLRRRLSQPYLYVSYCNVRILVRRDSYLDERRPSKPNTALKDVLCLC